MDDYNYLQLNSDTSFQLVAMEYNHIVQLVYTEIIQRQEMLDRLSVRMKNVLA